jgi:CelD/BcsL family acetyltransferase involved in cellulose biosynthesis
MNFFSSDPFLAALARTIFPGRAAAPCDVALEGRTFRLLRVGRSRLVHDARFLDYLEPLPDAAAPPLRAGFLRRVRLGEISAPFGPQAIPAGAMAAPYVRWERFSSFHTFMADTAASSFSVRTGNSRHARKLARDLGETRFVRHTDDVRVLEQLFAWKSAQYRRTSLPDLFASAPRRALFRHLLHSQAVELSALYAADRLVAAHIGPRLEGRFYYWVPAHDPNVGKLSPGTVLLEELLRASFEAGDHTFDLLLGGEAYKWRLATDVAVVGALGGAPALERTLTKVHALAKQTLGEVPSVWGAMQQARRYWRERQVAS